MYSFVIYCVSLLFQCVNLVVHTDHVEPSRDFNVTPALPVYWKVMSFLIRLEAVVKMVFII